MDESADGAVTIVRDFYRKLGSEETFADALGLLDEDLVFRAPPGLPYGGEYHGPSGFVDHMSRLVESVTPEMVGAMEFFDAGDRVVMRATGRFTSAASRQSVVTDITELVCVRDGKIADMDIYYKDPAAVDRLARS